YLLYQTMIGAWPIGTDRLLPYIEKACREAKQRTSWLTPNEEFEAATREFIEALYRDERFSRDFQSFVTPLVPAGRTNSLAQVLLKLTAPGVPDTYQGTELWDLSLVDTDNRRPVDFDLRSRLLDELKSRLAAGESERDVAIELLRNKEDGRIKLWLTWKSLAFR